MSRDFAGYSPLFQERKAAFLRELTGDPRAAFSDEIRRDAVPNFEFLQTVRGDEMQAPRLRVRAAQERRPVRAVGSAEGARVATHGGVRAAP
jgi:hypothetical protein